MQTTLHASEEGYPSLGITSIEINIGESSFVLIGGLVEWFANQFIDIFRIVLENSLNIFLRPILNVSLGTVLIYSLEAFLFTFPIELKEIGKAGFFAFNSKMTKDPLVAEDFIDLFLLADLVAGKSECTIPQTAPHEFINR